ncbi:MAG: DUF2793 domain-containing protein [Salaquimonas sp.]|nr:DUF2793 domain-containing protein [Salaquimonas sp.]
MDRSPNLDMPFILPSQAQKHVTHNEALWSLDALIQLAVLDRDLTAPPASPAEGDRHVVGASASGDWSGWDNDIACFSDGAWLRHTPNVGWLVFIADEQVFAYWDGSAWIDLGTALTALDNLARLGVGTSADETNPLAAKLNNVLLTAKYTAESGDGDLRVKANKEAAANAASYLFQTDYSGRAEFGLIGNDDFTIKVSADGSSWAEAISIDKDTGYVSFPSGSDGGGGGGSGDMLASVYDPTSVEGNAFDMDNMVEGSDTKVMTSAERTKLASVEAGATAEMTGAEIKAAYEAEADTNAFTNAERSKLADAVTEIDLGALATDIIPAVSGTLNLGTLPYRFSSVAGQSILGTDQVVAGGISALGTRGFTLGCTDGQPDMCFYHENDSMFPPSTGYKAMGLIYDGKGALGDAGLVIQELDDNGAFIANRSTLWRTGSISLGSVTPPGSDCSLTATGFVRPGAYTVSGLPSAANAGAGARLTVTDASNTTLNSVVAGGGTAKLLVYSDGADWRVYGGLGVSGGSSDGREQLTADRTYYISTTGSDSNDGLSAGSPFATIQKFLDTALETLDLGGFDCVGQLADGTYDSGYLQYPQTGSGRVIIQGNTTTPGNTIIDGGASDAAAEVAYGATLTVQHVRVQGGTNGFKAMLGGLLIGGPGLEFGACTAGSHILALSLGQIEMQYDYTIVDSAGESHYSAIEQGNIRSVSLTVTIPNVLAFTYFTNCEYLSLVSAYALTITGAGKAGTTGTRYNVTNFSVIFTNGAGGSYFPGNADGNNSPAGRYQ